VFTLSGDTALYLSKLRTRAPIFSFSPRGEVVKMLSLAFNVTAYQIGFQCHIDDLVRTAEQTLLSGKRVAVGDRLVLVSGTTPVRGATNYMQIKSISS
jgi:pyruvate kinase